MQINQTLIGDFFGECQEDFANDLFSTPTILLTLQKGLAN